MRKIFINYIINQEMQNISLLLPSILWAFIFLFIIIMKTLKLWFPESNFKVDEFGRVSELETWKVITVQEWHKTFIFNWSNEDLLKINKVIEGLPSPKENKELLWSISKQIFYKLNALGLITSVKTSVDLSLSFLDNIELE